MFKINSCKKSRSIERPGCFFASGFETGNRSKEGCSMNLCPEPLPNPLNPKKERVK